MSVCVRRLGVHSLTWGALGPQRRRTGQSALQFAVAVLFGLEMINKEGDWMVWSLCYQLGHQLLGGREKERRIQVTVVCVEKVEFCREQDKTQV